MHRLHLSILLLLATVVAGSAHAQSVPLRSGDQIRIRSAGISGQYRLIDLRDDTLTLEALSSGSAVEVPINSATRIDVFRGNRTRGSGAIRGATIGGLLGGASGAILGFADGDDPPGIVSFSAGEKATIGVVFLGSIGIVGGGLIGAASPGTRWERVERVRGIRVEPTAGGGLALGLTGRF